MPGNMIGQSGFLISAKVALPLSGGVSDISDSFKHCGGPLLGQKSKIKKSIGFLACSLRPVTFYNLQDKK